MRTYELVLVFDPALEVEQIDQDLRKLNELISANGAPRRWERWGKRRLTYEIAGRQYGYYVLAVFDSVSLHVAEIDRSIRLNATIIRHLITQVDPKRVPEADPESVRTLGAAPDSSTPVPPTVEDVELMEIAPVDDIIASDVKNDNGIPSEKDEPDKA